MQRFAHGDSQMSEISEGDKKYYRILNILNRLNSGPVNTRELAEEFNVSPRSVQRDIERINLTGFNLISEKRGTYSFAPGTSLKQMRLTDDQIYVLIMMRDKLASMGGHITEAFNSIFSRITAGTDADPLLYDINTKGLTPILKNTYDELSYAVRNRKYIKILYPGKAGLKEFILKPLKILTSDTFFYLLAVPTKKDILLKYRLDRIQKLEVLEKDFHIHEIKTLQSSLKTATSIWGVNTNEKKTIELEACGQAADFFRCKNVLPEQEISVSNQDKIRVRAKISHAMEVLPLILQWLPEIRIISPASLKDKIREKMIQVKEYIKEEFGI